MKGHLRKAACLGQNEGGWWQGGENEAEEIPPPACTQTFLPYPDTWGSVYLWLLLQKGQGWTTVVTNPQGLGALEECWPVLLVDRLGIAPAKFI